MKPVLSSLLAVLLTSVVAAPQAADGPERSVNQRQHNQQQRIHQGVRQGDLTRGEARQLQHQARDVRREERAFRSDGRFTAAERQQVQRDLNHVSRNIRHERHDGGRRFGHDGRYPGFDRGHGYGHASTRAFDSRVDHVQRDQRQRVEQGIRSGALTRSEAQRLMAEQRALEAEERRYLADGVLTQWERTDLARDLNVAGRHIYNETHDAQVRR
jgi:hypothetical protein